MSNAANEGQVVLITGASRNIGAAMSRAFAAAGAELILVARDSERLSAVASEIARDTVAVVHTVSADIGTKAGTDAVVEAALSTTGRVDVLINNAYTNEGSWQRDVLSLEDEVWADTLEVNLLGPWRLIKGLAPGMRDRGHGVIVNILSGAGFQPLTGFTPYGTSKAALWTMTRYLAAELAPHVRVNAVCPGLVSDTGAPRSSAEERVLLQIPMGRIGHPDEVCGAVQYLVSSAASYTTGAVIHCNGGRSW